MTSKQKDSTVVILVAGSVCLASAALNWWNMIGVGVTFLRIFLAGALTIIGLLLLSYGIRAKRAQQSKHSHNA